MATAKPSAVSDGAVGGAVGGSLCASVGRKRRKHPDERTETLAAGAATVGLKAPRAAAKSSQSATHGRAVSASGQHFTYSGVKAHDLHGAQGTTGVDAAAPAPAAAAAAAAGGAAGGAADSAADHLAWDSDSEGSDDDSAAWDERGTDYASAWRTGKPGGLQGVYLSDSDLDDYHNANYYNAIFGHRYPNSEIRVVVGPFHTAEPKPRSPTSPTTANPATQLASHRARFSWAVRELYPKWIINRPYSLASLSTHPRPASRRPLFVALFDTIDAPSNSTTISSGRSRSSGGSW
jgi:hypothetical protein